MPLNRRLTLGLVLLLAAALIVSAQTPHQGRGAAPHMTSASASVRAGWVNMTASLSPPGVGGGMMAYSSRADRFVLFGGSDGDPTNSTWVLDPSTGAWTLLHPTASPPVRVDGGLVYDSAANAFLLFGGWNETESGAYVRYGDTWAFFLANDTWVARHPVRSPSPRSDAAIAYDAADDVTTLFGGFNGTSYLGDEWAYTFGNDSWWPRPSARMPVARADGRMTYDPVTNALYMYGGNNYSGPNFTYYHLGDTWTYAWAQNRWTQLFPSANPGPRDYAVFAADTRSGVLVLSGGFGASVVLGDTWAFNTSRSEWGPVTSLSSPSPRMAAVGGYDPVEDVFVVFSGGDKVSVKNDTWFLWYPPPLVAQAGASTTETSMGQSVNFVAQVTGGSGFLTGAAWAFGDGTTGNGTSAAHSFAAAGMYAVTFTAVDDHGQRATSTIMVSVGLAGPLWADLAGTVIAVGAAATALVVLRRRRKPSPPGDRKTSDSGDGSVPRSGEAPPRSP